MNMQEVRIPSKTNLGKAPGKLTTAFHVNKIKTDHMTIDRDGANVPATAILLSDNSAISREAHAAPLDNVMSRPYSDGSSCS